MATESEHMQFAVRRSRIDLPRIAALGAGAYALTAGAVTLLGWVLDAPRLTDWVGSGIAMFPNTAVCASLSGLGLMLLTSNAVWRRRAARMVALSVALIGGLTLFQHVSGLNLGIDTLLFNQRPWGQLAAASPMRMGPPASTSFLILGMALLCLASGPRGRRLAGAFATLPVAIASLSLIGYWFGSDQLYSMVHLTGIAFQTSTIIAALAIGVIAAVPEHGLVALASRDDPGGTLVRKLVLPIVIIPLLVGWLRLLGQRAGFYDTSFGLSLVLLVTIGMLLSLLTWTAFGVSRAAQAARQSQSELDAVLQRELTERKQAELALREREQRYEMVLLGAEAAIWDWDVVHRRVIYSPRWKQLRGLTDAEVSDSEDEWKSRIHPEDCDRVAAAVQAHFEGRAPSFREEYRVRHKAGHWVWILDRGIARRDESGRVVRMAGSETDISERKQLEHELRLRLDELAERDQRKNEFLATLAHELRNPLAPIRNSIQILRASTPAGSDAAALHDIMERQVNHLVRLVDDLLEVSRITSGKIELRPERVDIAGVLQSAIETSMPLMNASGHEFRLSVPAEPTDRHGRPCPAVPGGGEPA